MNVRTPTAKQKRQRFRRLVIECFEARRMLASDARIALDFSPDVHPGVPAPVAFDQLFVESFWSTQTRGSDNHAFGTPNPGTTATDLDLLKRFLDFDLDGQLSQVDAVLAKQSVAVDVRRLFDSFSDDAGLPLQVQVVSSGSTTLQAARADDTLDIFVVYVGGKDFRSGTHDYGHSLQAPVAANHEYYAYTFAAEVADSMWSEASQFAVAGRNSHYGLLDKSDFSQRVANVIAREAAQLLGLGQTNNAKDSLLSPQRNTWLAGFADRNYSAELRNAQGQTFSASQNPHAEIVSSLDNSTVQNSFYPANHQYSASGPVARDSVPASWVFVAPSKTAPPATLGSKGTQTAASVAAALQSQFEQFRQSSFFNNIATRSDVVAATAPIIVGSSNVTLGFDGSDLATLVLQPGAAGYDAAGRLDLSGITTFAALKSRLQTAGFTVDVAITDSGFSQLPTSAAADLLRFSRTYRLDDLVGLAALNPLIFAALVETSAITASGQLRLDADVSMYLTMGFDTAGFYVLTGKTLENEVTGRGEIVGSLGSVGDSVGVATLSYASQVALNTTNSDGRIRLADIHSAPAGLLTQSINGAAGVDMHFQAAIGAAGTVQFDGGWQWDLTPTGLVHRPELSGYDEDTLLDSLTRIVGNGLNQLKLQAPKLISSLDEVPIFGPAVKSITETVLNDELDYDDVDGLSDVYLKEQNYEITVSASPQELINHLLKGVAPPSDLLRVRVNRSASSVPQPLTGSGSLTLGASGASFNSRLSGTGTAVATVSPDFVIGLDTLGGLYIVEGGKIQTGLTVTGVLNGIATLPGLVDGRFKTDAAFNAGGKLTIDDGDNVAGERVYIGGSQWSSILADADSYMVSGTITLTNTVLDAKVPQLTGLPSLKIYGSGHYDLGTAVGSFDVPPDAMLDAYAQIVAAGILKVRDDSLALSQMTRGIPLIGNDVAGVLDGAIKKALDVRFPTTNVRSYLEANHFTVVNVMPLQTLIAGPGNGSLLELRYNRTAASLPTSFSAAGVLKAGPATLDVAGSLVTTPTLTLDATFGVDAVKGPYVVEGGGITASLPTTGTVTGTATIGKLTKLGTTASLVNTNPSVGLQISDFDGVLSERLYLIDSQLGDGFDFDVLTGNLKKSVVLQGGINLNTTLTANNPAASFPLLSSVLPPAISWTSTVGYNLTTGAGTYNITQNAPFNQIVTALASSDAEKAILNLLAEKLDQYNPLPQSTRDLLTNDLPFIGFSLLDLLDVPESAQYLINPKGFKNKSAAELGQADPNNQITPKLELAKPENIVKLLSGDTAELVEVDIAQRFQTDNLVIPLFASPVFVSGILNVTVEVGLFGNAFFGADVSVGIDTDGFYIDESSDDTDFVFEVGGTFGAELKGTGYLTVFPFVEIIGRPGFKLTGGLLLDSHDQDNKLRLNELSDKRNHRLGLTLDFVLPISAEFGIISLGLTETVDQYYERPLYSAASGNLEDVEKQLMEEFKESLQKPIDDLKQKANLLNNLAGDIAREGKKIAGDVARESKAFVGQQIEQGKQIANQVGNAANAAAAGVKNAANRFQENVLGPLNQALGIDELGSVFGRGSYEAVSIPQRQNFNASVVNGTLVVDAIDNSAPLDVVIGQADGFLIIDGPDFVRNEEVGYYKSSCWNGCNKDWVREDIVHPNIYKVPLTSVTNLIVTGTPLNDSIVTVADVSIPVRLEGRQGDDYLVGGSGNDVLWGEDGNDKLIGGRGNDLMFGGSGADLLMGELGNDTLNGGSGNDTLDEATLSDASQYAIDRSGEANALFGDADNDTLRGAAGADRMFGGTGDDVIQGAGGNDTISGGSGRDALFGEDGDDTIDGDDDNDVIEGGEGNDIARGGSGNDAIYGDSKSGSGSGNDILQGGSGNDFIDGGRGNDHIEGNSGADYLLGGFGQDTLIGGSDSDPLDGNDVILGGPDNDVIYGGASGAGRAVYSASQPARDMLFGDSGNDTIDGQSGPDQIDGGYGDDTIDGGAGDDILLSGDGADLVRGGSGNDRLYGSLGPGGRTATLYGNDGNDELFGSPGADTMYGGAGNDTLLGYDGNDELRGEAGQDHIEGGGGDDRAYGGDGNDTILGGFGNDLLYGEVGDDTINGNAGNDTLSGGAGRDTLEGDDDNDTLDGDAGDDTLRGGTGNDRLRGGTDNDILEGDAGQDILEGGDGDDTLRGGLDKDVLYGGRGNDSLFGGSQDDQLFGEDGNDSLHGEDGNDSLSGGTGNDSLFGDAGLDRLLGDAGNDILHGGDHNDSLDGGAGDDQLFGNAGDDELIDPSGRNLLDGGAGNDTLRGGDDADELIGSQGDDRLFGFGGRDTLRGGTGRDYLDGGAGNDLLEGGDDNDDLLGGAGDDTLRGQAGDDRIFGGLDHDTIEGGAGKDFVDGESGNDQIFGGDDDDTLFGGDDDDHIDGGLGNDIISGDAGNDTLLGNDGDDRLFGEAGLDVLAGGSGNDELDGGTDRDVLWGGNILQAWSFFNAPDDFEFPADFLQAEAEFPSGYTPPMIQPKSVAGFSLAGDINDGKDWLRGGDGDDLLFGGSGADRIEGGRGQDYADGGAGEDDIDGQQDDDVVRGGAGNDTVHGGTGIDQVLGDDGDDQLYGDEGDEAGLVRQRLYGGPGNDSLFAYAATADPGSEAARLGDELRGGPGDDRLLGNLRRDRLVGEQGNDDLLGDALAGPSYVIRTGDSSTWAGADDELFGGLGSDFLFGNGGNDVLWGGEDADRLAGELGNDVSYGGSGIDVLVLDINAGAVDVLNGHGGNKTLSDSLDDFATDILLIEGDLGSIVDDTITLSENAASQLLVGYTGLAAPIVVDWKSAGVPNLEQIHVRGGAGNDRIEFLTGPSAVDTSMVTGRDWFSVLDGGVGNDTLIGGSGRDRIDGGAGNDTIYGYGGDDRLSGGDGLLSDHDILYAGSGNDDLFGGQGTNTLSAWSRDPSLGLQFGIFTDSDGKLFDDSGDFVGALDSQGNPIPDGKLDSDPTQPARTVEDTGINRMLGNPGDDELFGGTGIDFMYGRGGNDTLYRRDGTTFESMDGGIAGDEWKDYAKQSDRVWYVGGSNANDVISVDFVTEPGPLFNRHLVTRLTENNGNFTFAAQLQLDFNATDAGGNLIWDPNEILADLEGFENATAEDRRLVLEQQALAGNLLPPESDYLAILIDALDGNDTITVGPTVQKTVWVDAGKGDDIVKITAGNAILVDTYDESGRNDRAATASDLGTLPGSLSITDLSIDSPEDVDWYKVRFAQSPSGGQLQVRSASSQDGMSLLAYSGTPGNLQLERSVLSSDLAEPNNTSASSYDLGDLQTLISVDGLSFHLPTDVEDWYRFSLPAPSPTTPRRLTLRPQSESTSEWFGLIELSDAANVDRTGEAAITTTAGSTVIDFANLPAGNYKLRIVQQTAAQGGHPGAYSMAANVGVLGTRTLNVTGTATSALDLSGLTAGTDYYVQVRSQNIVPTIYSFDITLPYGTAETISAGHGTDYSSRRDVILGGPGNDILQGGPGEDWIFGGPGNDILNGGLDRQAGDLLFGEAGDDVFQIIPDALPRIAGTSQTTLPTTTDLFFGGTDRDSFYFLGGDLDGQRRPVPDQVAIRYDETNGRYEFTAIPWDVENQVSGRDPQTGLLLQHYQFFELVSIENGIIETRAGNDMVRADTTYILNGSQWGIGVNAVRRGATLIDLDIRGGDGDDLLVGGVGNDRIDGGAGNDQLIGGDGNDDLIGGDGDDFLEGNVSFVPDYYERVSRGGLTQSNDTAEFAADLGFVFPGQTISNLSFHSSGADQSDWYVFPTPLADFELDGSREAWLTSQDISVLTTDGTPQALEFSLHAVAFDGATVTIRDELAGVPDYYALQVRNNLNVATNYQIAIADPLRDSLHADPSIADDALAPADPLTRLLSQPVVIPIGDINGDGYDDFISSVRDELGDFGTIITQPGFRLGIDDPANFVPSSVATITLGSADPGTSLTKEILLPAPVNRSSAFGTRTSFAKPDDYNGDGIDDLVVVVDRPAIPTSAQIFGATPNFTAQGVYVIRGSAGLPMQIDVRTAWTNRVTGLAAGRISAASIGDTNNDGLRDLAIGSPDASSAVVNTFVLQGGGQGSIQAREIPVYLKPAGSGSRPSVSVTALGDVNNDSVDDFLTVSINNTTHVPTANVVFGKAQEYVDPTRLFADINQTPNPSGSTTISSSEGRLFVESLSGGLTTLNAVDAATAELRPLKLFTAIFKRYTVGDALFFTAHDENGLFDLWQSGGTPESTVRVREAYPQLATQQVAFVTEQTLSQEIPIVKSGSDIYLPGTNAAKGKEIWKLSGGVATIIEAVAGSGGLTNIRELIDVNGTAFFVAAQGATTSIWRITSGATITQMTPTLSARNLVNLGGVLYFANDSSTTPLWRVTGNTAAAVPFTGAQPNSATQLVATAGRVFLNGHDGTKQLVWSYNPLDSKFRTLHSSTSPWYLNSVGGVFFYTASQTGSISNWYRFTGVETATTAETQQVTSFTTLSGVPSFPELPVVLNDKLYFRNVNKLWSTSIAGGQQEIAPIVYQLQAIPAANLIAYTAGSNSVFVYEPATQSTNTIIGFPASNEGSSPSNFVESGGNLYFVANNQLWVSGPDGSNSRRVSNVVFDSFGTRQLVANNGVVYFVPNDGKLWTAVGETAQAISTALFPTALTRVGNRVYFVSTSGDREWYVVNGSVVTKIDANTAGSSFPGNIVDVGGAAFFAATNAQNNRRVFSHDGATLIDRGTTSNNTTLYSSAGNLYRNAYLGFTPPQWSFDLRQSNGSWTTLGTFSDDSFNFGGVVSVTHIDGQLYVSSGAQLLRFNQSTQTFVALSGASTLGYDSIERLIGSGSSLYFIARRLNQSTFLNEYSLWYWNGSQSVPVSGNLGLEPHVIDHTNGSVVYSGINAGVVGQELYQFDPAGGNALLRKSMPGTPGIRMFSHSMFSRRVVIQRTLARHSARFSSRPMTAAWERKSGRPTESRLCRYPAVGIWPTRQGL